MGDEPDTADDLIHGDYIIHDRDIAEELRGPELYKRLAVETRAIFPDMEFNIEDMISAADKVALRWMMTGTHEGELFEVEPTGKQIRLQAIEINRLEAGQFIKTWTQSDQYGLMTQLGAEPAKSDR